MSAEAQRAGAAFVAQLAERSPSNACEQWSEPIDLPGLPSVPEWNDALLPESLRPWLFDVTERTQCPAEYVAAGAIVTLASVVGRAVGIRPKRQDDWTVVPNLWGAIVGPPSGMKTPALREAMRPVLALASEASAQHEARRFDREALDAQQRALAAKMQKTAREGGDLNDLRAEHDALAASLDRANLERRYVVYETSTEKLGEILRASPRGSLLFRDELAGWLASLDRQGHECDRAFFLEAWNGDSGFVYDRIGRGTVRIDAACVGRGRQCQKCQKPFPRKANPLLALLALPPPHVWSYPGLRFARCSASWLRSWPSCRLLRRLCSTYPIQADASSTPAPMNGWPWWDWIGRARCMLCSID